ncbi:hypothetical protein [Paenibacillus wynnii]|uniref:Uncharacterized protein n=1 Tax=Paenibacillus wynnii TaxID=268407 RepID=A0A098MCL8_9BACL|nr:hypothetical protein [Paenibacillus wynnii]KGE19791.1 hypothetical protein PWYN_10915 [Paenibacillus wynnii]
MIPNYIYALPHMIKEQAGTNNQVEIITQKSSFTMRNNELFSIVQKLLLFIEDNTIFSTVLAHFNNKLSEEKIQDILMFLDKHEVIFLSETPVAEPERKLILLLSQYTNSLHKYLEQLKNITFCIYAHGDYTRIMEELLGSLGLQYKLTAKDQLAELTEADFLLVGVDSTRMHILDEINEIVRDQEGCLWSFVLFYSDSYMISPILNQKNYIGYSCMKDQIKMPQGQHGISKNMLLENMGINELLLEIITSLTKLNIKTSYGRAIIFNSVDKMLDVEKVYYLPRYPKAFYIKRWDGEK